MQEIIKPSNIGKDHIGERELKRATREEIEAGFERRRKLILGGAQILSILQGQGVYFGKRDLRLEKHVAEGIHKSYSSRFIPDRYVELQADIIGIEAKGIQEHKKDEDRLVYSPTDNVVFRQDFPHWEYVGSSDRVVFKGNPAFILGDDRKFGHKELGDVWYLTGDTPGQERRYFIPVSGLKDIRQAVWDTGF